MIGTYDDIYIQNVERVGYQLLSKHGPKGLTLVLLLRSDPGATLTNLIVVSL